MSETDCQLKNLQFCKEYKSTHNPTAISDFCLIESLSLEFNSKTE